MQLHREQSFVLPHLRRDRPKFVAETLAVGCVGGMTPAGTLGLSSAAVLRRAAPFTRRSAAVPSQAPWLYDSDDLWRIARDRR